MLKLNTKLVNDYLGQEEVSMLQPFVDVAHKLVEEKTGVGSDFLGWVNLPHDYDKDEFMRIQKTANKIQNDSDVLLVIGIGGSYLGAKAVIDFLNHHFVNSLSKEQRKLPEIYFVGHNISSSYMKDLEDVIDGKDFSINIISKSGTTTEPALAFRHFKNLLVNKYGVEAANNRIYATTDAEKGSLKEQSIANSWESFVVPDDVGGRFSVLTAVGLLPIAVSGANIEQLMSGAALACDDFKTSNINSNDCYKYAVLRNCLYNRGKSIEMLVGYEPTLQYFNEWWKQLYAESEGKDGKGIFPASVIFSTDLHSMGQFIQSGRRDLFETVITIKNVRNDIEIKPEEVDGDGLNYLAGKTVSYVNNKAFEATAIAHTSGNVPNIILELEAMDAKSLGYMIYFFEKACAISGYLLGINPFDQPGVEEYKKNMFALLGKPGFEELKKELESKL